MNFAFEVAGIRGEYGRTCDSANPVKALRALKTSVSELHPPPQT
jgi:hypothetical protein